MRFRKKPVEIEAWLAKEISDLVKNNWHSLPDSIKNAYEQGGWVFESNGSIHIHTLEGTMIAAPQDYIIKGIAGEFYPCKPDIFSKTYEAQATTDDASR